MSDHEETESVPADAVRHRDVMQNPETGRWFTVTRIVSGELKAEEDTGTEVQQAAEHVWSFYGDERREESVTLYGERPTVTRRKTD
jgi:hypothetical protein